MAVFVINEWLWSDMSGSNGPQFQREAFIVIERLPRSEHQIVVIQGSPFDQKAFRLCKSTNPMIVQRMAGAYMANLRLNLDRCVILQPEAVGPLPEELASKVDTKDHYLVQAQLTVAGAIIVTTDGPLREALNSAGLLSLAREDFFNQYF
jgi:hypothetical protein